MWSMCHAQHIHHNLSRFIGIDHIPHIPSSHLIGSRLTVLSPGFPYPFAAPLLRRRRPYDREPALPDEI